MNLDSSKVGGPDCIPVVVVLKSLSFNAYLAEGVLFSRFLYDLICASCIYLKISHEGLQLKTTTTVNLFFVVAKSLKNL